MPAVDEIVLTIPRERRFYGVAHLVLGGLGSRLNLTLEHLEDLQLGLDSLLAQQDGQEDVTLRIRVLDGRSRPRSARSRRPSRRRWRRAAVPASACGGSWTPSPTKSVSANVTARPGSR